MNTKISRQKLKITKYFGIKKEIPKTVTKINNYNTPILTKKRKSSNSLLLTELKTENNDINSYLTSSKINIKKKLKQNKTEYNFTQSNNNKYNKTFDKINIPFNKEKSFSDFNNYLTKSNYRSHMTQTSNSFLKNKESDKSLYPKKLQKINNLELSNSFNVNQSKKFTYIDYQINQILSKKKEKINNEFHLVNNNQNLSRSMLRLKYNNYYNHMNQKYDEKHLNNTYINKTFNTNNVNNNNIYNNKENENKGKFHVKKIYFQDELENLFHKINIIKNNKNESGNLVISLTNEELKLLYENKDLIPLLIKNKYNNKLTENEKSKSKGDRKLNGLRNISFENNLLNLFIKGNPKETKPLIKTDFPKIQYKENDKNNSSVNYDHIKYQQVSNHSSNFNNKNTLSKSQIYKKINMKKSLEKSDEEILKKDFIFLGYKNKLSANPYNKEEIKKGEKIWETWFADVINKNKNKNKNKDINININDKIYENMIKKEEEEFKKIIIKKMMRQNSFKISNKINNNKDEAFLLPKEIEKKIKNKNINKSQIINEERVLDKIKKKFLIDIFSYISTPQGKLNLKLILNNVDEENDIDKKVNSNQIKNKIILQSFIPKKILSKTKSKLISNPYIIREEQNKIEEENNEEEEESEENSDANNNIMNNLNYIPFSLRKFFLEKYKVTDESRFSKLINLDIINELKGKKKKNNKKNYQKKIIIKVDNHNEKMVNNYLQNLQNKKNKNNERNKSSKNKTKDNPKIKPKEKTETIQKKKEEFRIINIFGIKIRIQKGIPPIQYLYDYMRKKGIESNEEFKSRVELKNKLTKLISKLKLERKKKKRKTKAINRQNLSKILDINYNADDLVKFAHRGTSSDLIATTKKLKFFDTSLIKSRKDVEKRKMQILLKFKNDIEYKAMTGDIDQTEVDMFSKLEAKMDKLMDLININEYMAKMEDYIGEFQEEMNLREKSRKDEKRINGFIENLNDDINFKISKKNYILNRFGKIINFKKVNSISKLNEI